MTSSTPRNRPAGHDAGRRVTAAGWGNAVVSSPGQAARPPSSTATGWPSARSSHHARAAIDPLASSYTTTGRSWATPSRASAADTTEASGSGCRPDAGVAGAARSASRSKKWAPGTWPRA
jgi:hypothetical protein